MIGNGRIIDDDMFGIVRRLKSIDDGYFVVHNYKTGKFEVHNGKCVPRTLCLVLPYETLDERTVRRVNMTRAEKVEQLIAQAERDNALIERRSKAAALDRILSAVGG